MDSLYLLGLLATVTFSASGVLAVRDRRIDLFGVLVVGVVTAIGGGTIRDLILSAPVFWLSDAAYLWCALGAALLTFGLREQVVRAQRVLLYLDALGAALFAALAVNKTLGLGLQPVHAAVMGLVTGIGGGIIRDLLTGRPTMIMMRDLYATPILFGIGVQIGLLSYSTLDPLACTLLGMGAIFVSRAAAIYFRWQMPAALSFNHDRD